MEEAGNILSGTPIVMSQAEVNELSNSLSEKEAG
jgi:hypothetical protein